MPDLVVVDLSHWNQPPASGWQEAVAAGLCGAIIKHTQGSELLDPSAMMHLRDAKAAGVPLLGAYHFGDSSPPEDQAEYFLYNVRQTFGMDLSGVMLMLDVERNQPQMTVAEAAEFVQAIQDAEGRWPWLYMGKYGPSGSGADLPNQVLAQCPLICPAYGKHEGALAEILPPGWKLPEDETTRGGMLRGWQFTDGTINGGPFPGLGRVDQSRLIGVGSVETARALWT